MDKVAKKVNEEQAARIILNLDDSQVQLEALKRQLIENPIVDLKAIIIVKRGKVIPFYP